MPVEVEAKFKVESHETVRRRLNDLGGRYVGRVLEDNHIFDRSDGSLRKAGCGLRVRAYRVLDGDDRLATLTFKGKRQPGAMKTRDEIEVGVTDGGQMIEMLTALGFVEAIRFEKRRETWTHAGCTVELDEVPRLGCYIEIEGEDESRIRRVVEALDLAGQRTITDSYIRLLIDHADRNNLPTTPIRFK